VCRLEVGQVVAAWWRRVAKAEHDAITCSSWNTVDRDRPHLKAENRK